MTLLEQLVAMVASLQTLQTQVAEMQTKLVDAEAALAETAKAKYDEGFAAGVASVGGDKIYSEEELQAKILEVKEPLEKKIAELEVVVGGIDQLVADKVTEAMASYKAELLEKVKVIDAIEDEAMAELLK